MGNIESRKLIEGYFNFIVGNTDAYERHLITRFIDRRSRIPELLRMQNYYPVIKSGYRKQDLIEFFCNLKSTERLRLLEEVRDMIVALPFDFKLFKISQTSVVSFRYANFGGKTVEYPVFSIIDFLTALQKTREVSK